MKQLSPLWDTHMHCYFSGDSEAAPNDMILAAIKKGISGICFTDHLDYDYKEEPGLFDLDVDAYQKEICQLQQQYKETLPIRFGIEIGLQPHVVEENRAITTSYPFDFVIGSSHVVHGVDPYYEIYWQNRTEEEAIREYFSSILENLATNPDFDVYGHIDYVIRYAPTKNINYTYIKYADVIDEILTKLITSGKGIEINTGGFASGLGEPNPCIDIIKRYRKLGGEIITVGADAHAPARVAADFDKVLPILKEAGFDYITVFSKRQPEFIKLL